MRFGPERCLVLAKLHSVFHLIDSLYYDQPLHPYVITRSLNGVLTPFIIIVHRLESVLHNGKVSISTCHSYMSTTLFQEAFD